MIANERDTRSDFVLSVAAAMMAAARTAPKGKGLDNLEIITIYGDDRKKLADAMRAHSKDSGMKFFLRDANNIEDAEAVVVIGTRISPFGLNCGYCGFDTCAEKNKMPNVPCAVNTNDMGLAIGSAVSVAADHRIDTRVMFSAGKAALNLGLLDGCTSAFAIAMSCTAKSPFFDRVSPVQPTEQK